jgi:DNA invertase Pin-like site-specific DNA recombinase
MVPLAEMPLGAATRHGLRRHKTAKHGLTSMPDTAQPNKGDDAMPIARHTHTAIYLRVSSKQQDTRSQEFDLKFWAEVHGGPIRWYRDTFTGRSFDRPGWQRLEADIAAGLVERIVMWRLDRLGRTAAGLTALFDRLTASGIGLVSLRDGLDLTTPAGKLMANVLASVAQYETEVRLERVLAGQAAARASGKTWGGWQKGKRRKVTAEQLATIHRLHAENVPVTSIARATGLSRPTVYSVLAESALAVPNGRAEQNGTTIDQRQPI